jgi:hypothetical protein
MASSVSQSIPRRTSYTEAHVSPISLEGLRANEDILEKKNYIVQHLKAMTTERADYSQSLLLEVRRCERARLKLESKPLDTKQDAMESGRKRKKILERMEVILEQAERNKEEVFIIQANLIELVEAGKFGNMHYVEWILMPSLVWNLARLG